VAVDDRTTRHLTTEDHLAPGASAGAGGVTPAEVLRQVFEALTERGYDPIDQLVGYLLSGDPAYITGHRGARAAIRQVGRDELLEELVRHFVRRMVP